MRLLRRWLRRRRAAPRVPRWMLANILVEIPRPDARPTPMRGSMSSHKINLRRS